MPGNIELSLNDRRWSFYPDGEWAAGDYSLSVVTDLADLAGNSLKRSFEVDMRAARDAREPESRIELPFRIAP